MKNFADFPPEERQALAALAESASDLQPDERFIKQTEQKLMAAFAKKEKTMKRLHMAWQILAGTAATVALVLGIVWLVRSVIPQPRTPALPLGNPVTTTPTPAPENPTEIPPVPPAEELPFDYTVVAGDTCISIAAAFVAPVNTIIVLNNLPADCSTLTVGQVIKIPAPTPIVAHQGELAPAGAPEPGAYDWHGTQVKLAVPFPTALDATTLYSYSAYPAISIETAGELAQRFGVQGEVYLDPTSFTPVVENGPAYQIKPAGPNGYTDSSYYSSTITYVVTNGKQGVTLSSSGDFSYYPDYARSFEEAPVSLETAAAPIDAFLKAHGYYFAYQLQAANGMGSGWFHVVPQTLEGRAVRFDFGLAQRMDFHLSPQGEILALNAYLLNLDSAEPVGNFGLISAEEAWQKFLDDSLGAVQSVRGGSSDRFLWRHVYPDDQPVVAYGYVTSFPAAAEGQPPLIELDGLPATGSTTGMEKLDFNTFVEARGQFYAEGGLRKFKVASWQVFDQAQMQYLEGQLTSQDGKFVFSSQGTTYTLLDAPADLPAPAENVSISGLAEGATLNWQSILYMPNPGGGGGGGGGNFAKLNLDGPPVPWVTPTPLPAGLPVALPTGEQVEALRGTLFITIFEQADGSRRAQYTLASSEAAYVLAGPDLARLDNNHNRPLRVWGTVTGYNQDNMPILTLERFEIPFPGLKFQVLRGTQQLIDVNGQQVTLFTTEDGKSYVQIYAENQPDSSLLGREGDLVEYEALLIPDETFGGYPAMRVFSGGMATNPKNGQPVELQITADQPYVVPNASSGSSGPVSNPTLTVELIELAYYTPDPHYAASYPDAMSPYLQPVWHFHGHYSDGSEWDALIQALQPDYLLPEPAPGIQGG